MRNLIQSLNPKSYHARPFLGPRTSYTIASVWGVLSNIDSAIGTATTATTGMQVPVEDEKFWVFLYSTGTNVGTSTWQFVTGGWGTWSRIYRYSISWLTNTWTTYCRSQKLSTTSWWASATLDYLSKYAYPVKPSTKYKITTRLNVTSFTAVWTTPWITLVTDEFNTAWTRVAASSWSWTNYTASTWGLVYNTIYITTNASAAFLNLVLYMISGNGSVDWDINGTKVEEIIEPVANSLSSSAPSLVSLTAVGSTDNIDQIQVTNNASQWLGTTAEQMLAQPFTPTKSKYLGFVMQKAASAGTFVGNITASVVSDNAGSPGSTVYASKTYTAAEWNAIANSTDFTINLPCKLTVGSPYWEQLSCSTADNTNYALVRINNGSSAQMKSYNGTTWSAALTRAYYYKSLYYKPTTSLKASQNNSSVSMTADEDGFNDGTIINLKTSKFTDFKNFWTLYTGILSIFQYLLSGWLYNQWTNNLRFDFANEYITLKFQAPEGLNFWDISYWTKTVSGWSAWRPQYIDYSYDNATWVNLSTVSTASTTVETTFTIPGGHNEVYVRYLNGVSNNANFIYYYNFVSTLDLSSFPTLRNYPTNKDVVKQYFTTLWSPTTTATYRANKWGFPAIEYSSTEYQYIDRDTRATGSVVAFSELWTSYTTVADGASITIASTSTPSIFVKTNITANRLLLSSNDSNAAAWADGSMKQSVVYQT